MSADILGRVQEELRVCTQPCDGSNPIWIWSSWSKNGAFELSLQLEKKSAILISLAVIW